MSAASKRNGVNATGVCRQKLGSAIMPRILLVDDDTAVRLVFLEILIDAGYEVDTAHSYETGAAILDSSYNFDLLITDGTFAGGTGAALADRASARDIPVLVVTGNIFNVDATRYTVLAKPMRADALLAAVASMLPGGSR
jgi:CheY-like chemotaxis protein